MTNSAIIRSSCFVFLLHLHVRHPQFVQVRLPVVTLFGVRLPSVFCWSIVSKSIECLALIELHVGFVADGIGSRPRDIAPW